MDKVSQLPGASDQIAREWVAKLDAADLSASDAEGLRLWLAEDPDNAALLAKRLDDWSALNLLSELTHFGLNDHRQGMGERMRRFWMPVTTAGYAAYGLAVLLIAVLFTSSELGLDVMPSSDEPTEFVGLDITTLVGEVAVESLPDGSVVHVNTISEAEISYTEDERSVVLKSGEAFFDVAHETDRPFIVYAGETSVRAVGTAFAVHLENGAVSVSVTEGTVEFTSEGITTLVSAETDSFEDAAVDQAQGNVIFYEDSQTVVNIESLEILNRRFSWQEGMLEFRGEPLAQAVEELSRYTSARIEIVDDSIRDVRLGGYFKIGDLDGLASTLELGFDIHMDVVSEDLIQLSSAVN